LVPVIVRIHPSGRQILSGSDLPPKISTSHN
jgi:hypothetical protein